MLGLNSCTILPLPGKEEKLLFEYFIRFVSELEAGTFLSYCGPASTVSTYTPTELPIRPFDVTYHVAQPRLCNITAFGIDQQAFIPPNAKMLIPLRILHPGVLYF